MRSILYIDDEPALLDIAKIFLEKTGEFAVVTGESAAAALQYLKSHQVDAIVSDYQMPGMSGIELLVAVRELHGNVPFILFTGKGREEVVIQAINNGADFYLQKGGDPTAQFAELTHKIKKAVENRQALEALRDSEQRLTDIIDFLPDATFAIDRDGRVITWNHAIEQMTGVKAAEMLGKGDYEYAVPFYGTRRPLLIDLIHESDATIAQLYGHIVREKDTLTADTILPRLKGRPVTLMGMASPLYNREGRIVGAIESIRNITDRKTAEENLLHAKKDWEIIFRAIGHPAVVLDKNNHIIDANDATLRMTGKTLDALKGMRCYEVFHSPGTDQPPESCPFEQLRKSGAADSAGTDIELPNGWFHINCTPVFDEGGQLEKVIHIAMDITAQRQERDELAATYEQLAASEELLRRQFEELAESGPRIRESEEKYRMLVEATRDIIFSLTPKGTIRYVSPQSVSQLGYQPEELEGQDFTRIIHPDDADILAAHVREHTGAGIPVPSDQFRIRRKDGTYCWFEDKTIYTIDPGGEPVVVGTIRDISEQKEVEEELRESEKNYRLLFENLNSGFALNEIILDTNGKPTDFRLIAANPAFEQVTGLKRETQMGRTYREVYPGTDQSLIDMFADVALKGTPRSFERFHPVLSRWWNMHAFSPRHGQFAVIINDITERKKAEIALRESEEKFRGIFENTSVAVFRTRRDGSMVTVNPAFARLLGYETPEDAVRGVPDIRQIYVDPARRDELFRILSDTGTAEDFELALRRPDGNILWASVNVRAVHDSDGTITGLEGLAVDITRRKRAEVALRESEEKFRALVETTSDFIWEVDENGTYTYVSPKVRDLLGYEPAELIGKTPFDFMPAGEADRIRAEFGRCVTSRLPIPALENRNLKKDGSVVTLETSGVPRFDSDGRFLGYRGIDRDISDRKQVADALQALVRGMVGTTGTDSLDRITESVAGWLGVDCVMVGEILPGRERVRVLSMILDGRHVTDFYYTLKGSPCENVTEKGYCVYPEHAVSLFPTAKDMVELNIQGYVGTPLRNAEGQVMGILCVLSRKPMQPDPGMQAIMDIIAVKAAAEIERKRAEELLKESEEWFRSILSAAQAGIILVDAATHQIVEANPKALDLIGAPRDMVIGAVCHRFICPAERGKCPVTDLNQNVDTSERTLLTASGAAIPVFKTVVPVSIGGRNMLVESFIDISEQKHAEAAIREANRKLNLLNNITRHDVANQLTVLKGYTGLARFAKPEPVIAGFLAKIADSAEAIQRQIDFTRTYQDLGMSAPSWQQIGEVIQRVRPDTVALTITCNGYEIFADQMLEKVFFNLFDNAVRHGEHVTAISVTCVAADKELVITVEDNGTGIPLDVKQKIFERGYGRNTGFGLFLAREILAFTGIGVYETGLYGKGARFELHVPAGNFRPGARDQPAP